MVLKQLYIDIFINPRRAVGGIKLLRNSVNLLKSTLTALFRTGSIALIFGGIRSVIGIMNQLKTSISNTTKELVELNLAGMKTAAVLTKGGSGTGLAYEQVSQLAREASIEVGRTAKEIQSGLYTAALAGNTVEEAYGLTNSSMKMATIAGNDFNSTIDGLIGVSRVFQVEMSKIPGLSDTITAAFTNAKMNLEGFFTAMSYVAPIAATYFGKTKETIKDTAAALMSLSDQGFSASKSGVYLRGTMNKLAGGTAKAAIMFAKYGVNIYRADGEGQRFLNTLTKGQKALANYYEKLNKLKDTQFDLVLAGKSGSTAFEEIGESLKDTSNNISELEAGLSRIFKQFTLAGGKMKPLATILDLMKRIPSEVVTRTFGVRGGAGAGALLGRPDLYKKKRGILEEAMKESAKGRSILDKMFKEVVNTFKITWDRIVSSITASFQVIFDPFIRAANELFQPIQKGLESFYKSLESNKKVFKEWAASLGDALIPVFKAAGEKITALGKLLKEAFTGGSEITVPMYSFDEGRVRTEKVKSKTGKVGEKVILIAKSMASLFIAHLKAMLSVLQEPLNLLAEGFGEGIITYLKTKMEFFKSIGIAIGKTIVKSAILAWKNRDKAVYYDPSTGKTQVDEEKLAKMAQKDWKRMIPLTGKQQMLDESRQLKLFEEARKAGTLAKAPVTFGKETPKIGKGDVGYMREKIYDEPKKYGSGTGWMDFGEGKINIPELLKEIAAKGKKQVPLGGGGSVAQGLLSSYTVKDTSELDLYRKSITPNKAVKANLKRIAVEATNAATEMLNSGNVTVKAMRALAGTAQYNAAEIRKAQASIDAISRRVNQKERGSE